jgi:hypothetical protein
MVQAEGNLDRDVNTQLTLTQMAVKPLTLVDLDNTNTIVVNFTDALTLATKKEYKIDASAGAADYYFYIDPKSTQGYKLIGFNVTVDAAVVLNGTMQSYRGGRWISNPAYVFPYGGGTYTATEAQEDVAVYPLEQGIFRCPVRIKCTVGGACNIFCQAMEG